MSSAASSESPVNFTVDLFEKTKDFSLRTGILAAKMSDEMIDKIVKGGGEYHPSKKTWVVPHSKLCDLLDECFDYFTEESLVNISKLLDKANVDKEIKDKVREKSVSKSGGSQKKEVRHRMMPSMIEEEEVLSKSSLRNASPLRPSKRSELVFGGAPRIERLDRQERSFAEPRSSASSALYGGNYINEKAELMMMMTDLRTRLTKMEQFIIKNM